MQTLNTWDIGKPQFTFQTLKNLKSIWQKIQRAKFLTTSYFTPQAKMKRSQFDQAKPWWKQSSRIVLCLNWTPRLERNCLRLQVLSKLETKSSSEIELSKDWKGTPVSVKVWIKLSFLNWSKALEKASWNSLVFEQALMGTCPNMWMKVKWYQIQARS